MKQTVYVDVLLAVNFFINYFLMLSVGKIMKAKISRTRVCLAAVFGAVGSLSVFLPPMSAPVSMGYKLAMSAGMVAMAYRQRSLRGFGRYLLVTCAVTFGFGGTMLALWLTAAPRGMYYRNGVAYFHLSPEFIIAATVLCYTVITIAGKITDRLERRAGYCDAVIDGERGAAAVRLMCDTGNLLREPFSGYPVVVVRRSAVRKILPEHFAEGLFAGDSGAESLPRNFRVIPYSAVGGDGLLTAFQPRRVRITNRKSVRELENCYIAVTDSFEDGEYDGVINPKIFEP